MKSLPKSNDIALLSNLVIMWKYHHFPHGSKKNWLLIDMISWLLIYWYWQLMEDDLKKNVRLVIFSIHHTCIWWKMDDSMNHKSFSSIILCYLFQLSRAPPPAWLLSFLIVLIRTFFYFLLEEIRNEFAMFWRKIHLKWKKNIAIYVASIQCFMH